MTEMNNEGMTPYEKDNARPGVKYEPHGPLCFFYGSWFGRMLLRPLISRPISRLVGWYLSLPASTRLIAGTVEKNQIDMSQFEEIKYRNFNEFFTRRIKVGQRTFSQEPYDLCAPCDSSVTAYRIAQDTSVVVKGSPYTVTQLLDDENLAEKFVGGWFLVFRLAVRDYHRYAYPDDAKILKTARIRGVFHTVQPIAFEHYNVYHRNTREWTLMETEHFGQMAFVEVGALAVGRITNHHGKEHVVRGEEKGYFEFGGSTVVLLLQAGAAEIDADILANTDAGYETPVKQGEVVGRQMPEKSEK